MAGASDIHLPVKSQPYHADVLHQAHFSLLNKHCQQFPDMTDLIMTEVTPSTYLKVSIEAC